MISSMMLLEHCQRLGDDNNHTYGDIYGLAAIDGGNVATWHHEDLAISFKI